MAGPYRQTVRDGCHILRYPKSQTPARSAKENLAHNGSRKAGSDGS